MIKKDCKYCNKLFTPKSHGGTKEFCSYTCSNTYKWKKRDKKPAKRKIIKCKNCEKEFEVYLSDFKYRTVVKFCSNKCSFENKKVEGDKKREWIKCDNCGKPKFKLKNRINKFKNSFCGLNCSKEHRSKNPLNKGGCWLENGYKVLYTGNGKGIKEHHKVMKEFIGRDLFLNEVVHHKNRNKLDNRIENLELLTRSDHQKKHRLNKPMRIKIDQADKVFSEYIRRRDGECIRCKRKGTGDKGIIGLQNSHYFGRRAESTRFDPENCDALCFGCHQYLGSDNREDYRQFKINQLGQQRYDLLCIRNRTTQRRDRKLSLIISKELLKTLD